ncbi:MAG TPA: DUF342 domain-containing protein [Clostridiales bacterium]|nr:MAG: hypothetical protein A2Y18_05955 [Clostridiales bacterium GWD2_32_19]HCC08287.1 DUF342 domain-containing protein [Clostridiales bacterium]
MDEKDDSQQIQKNESMTVKITPDKMDAYIMFHAPKNDGRKLTKEEIQDYIQLEGLRESIDQGALESLFESRNYEFLYNIAQGKQTIKGEDGKVIYNFQTEKKIKPKEREDGTVDFYNLNLIENVHDGDVLAVIIPPTDGEDGYNVLGQPLFASKGKPVNAKRGRNVSVSDDGLKLFATKDGQVGLIDGKIVINEVFEVASDVNTSTGNINFVGSVIIRGNVLSDFKVFAAGNIDIYGVVEGAILESKGSMNLHSGVLGNGKAEIKVGGDLVAKYIENCNVIVSGNIVSEAILHSNVRCSKNIEIGGKTGLIVGGVVTAGKLIKAKVVGSNFGTCTELKVGIDPNLIEMYKKNKEEIERIKDEKVKSGQLQELLEAKNKKSLLDDEKKGLLEKIVHTNNSITRRIEELNEEQELLMQKIQEIENGEIKIEQKICPNVEIYISNAYMRTKEDLSRCTLRKEGADVKISAY